MHAEEPTEPIAVNHPAEDAWRAEVASRVNSYQARRKRRYAGENSPALDFGPGAAAQSFGSASQSTAVQNVGPAAHASSGRVVSGVISPGAETRAGNAVRNAIDTNYYRRLNAESMAQGASPGMDEVIAATPPAPQDEAEWDEGATDDSSTDHDAALNASALDLEIRPTAAESEAPAPPVQEKPVQGNLIVFPRPVLEPPLLPQPSRDELAEPMNRRPRILEVPEDIMPVVQGSLFPEIRLDGDEEEGAGSREPEIEVPLRVAPLAARLLAGLADWGVAMAAGLLFAGMAWRALPDIPHAKPFWMVLSAVTLLLWAIYQHLFLLYAGRTLGMSINGIRLSTFDGQPPLWEQRRRRARFMVISFAAVTLGFLWALADEDALCWHDRISHTFPTADE